MKKILIAFIITSFSAISYAQVYEMRINESKVEWEAEKVTGGHHGTVDLLRGELTMIDGKLSKGEFLIDMRSIQCLDLKGEDQRELEGHLKSPDFFNTSDYPTALLTIQKASIRGRNKYKAEGKMTIKGTTHNVEFFATLQENGGEVTARADLTIDRTEFEIRYGSGSFFDDLGDMVISDNFKLKILLKASSESMN